MVRQAQRIVARLHPGVEELSDEQRAGVVRKILGVEPIFINAMLLKLAMDERSKWNSRITAMEVHKIGMDLHYALHPAPDRRQRSGDDQFELNFEWGEDGVARLAEAAE